MRHAAILCATAFACTAVHALEPRPGYELDYALAHRIFDEYYACGEHREGELAHVGDALGADCMVQTLEDIDGREIARAYRGDGARNEDWYGWKANVLSPCDCEVVNININGDVNQPGVLGKPPATFVVLKRDDGVHFLLAHLGAIGVEAKSRVRTGQVLGTVGNNGYGRSPHIHIGAWYEGTPLQIRFYLGKRAERTKPAPGKAREAKK
jgi:hypothetical protein